MTEHKTSASIDKTFHSDALDSYVQGLIEQPVGNGEHDATTETEEGIAIIDRFVGALARRGDIVDSHGQKHDVETTLRFMGMIQAEQDLLNFTSNGGLRKAVKLLVNDPRTVQLLSSAYGEALVKDESGRMLLRNREQLEGYIHGGANNIVSNPRGGVELPDSQWTSIFEERIDMVLERNGQWIFDPYKGIIESDNDYLRQEGNKWRMATSSAQRVGVDPSLIGRSVETIRAKQRAEKQALGGSALSTTVEKDH